MAKPVQFQVDFRDKQPVYQQIVSQVQAQVASGDLKPGDQLPTVRQVAESLRVNFNTVARAYRILDEAGIISTQHGRGTYIWEQPSPELSHLQRREHLTKLTRQYFEDASRLGFTEPETLRILQAEWAAWKKEPPARESME